MKTTNSSAIIVEQLSSILVEPLTAASVVLGSGATVIETAGPVRVPVIDRELSSAWVGEAETIPTAEAQFSEIQLMPTNRKSLKTLVRVSNELIRSASLSVESVLTNRLVTDVATKLDTALLTGDGANDTITGIINQPIDKMPLNVKSTDFILDALAQLASREVKANTLILSGADFYALQKLKDSTGRGLLQPDATSGAAYSVHGVTVIPTNKLTAGKGILADMSQVAVARDTEPRFEIDSSRYFDSDETAIRVTTRFDLGLLRPQAVLLLDSTVSEFTAHETS